jgi:hypothetical protein
MEKRNRFNVNTGLLTICNLLVLLVGFFSKHELERMEDGQAKLWLAIMPRHEIEIQLQEIKSVQTHSDTRILELQARQTLIEISLAKIQR